MIHEADFQTFIAIVKKSIIKSKKFKPATMKEAIMKISALRGDIVFDEKYVQESEN